MALSVFKLLLSSQRHFPGDVLHHCFGILQAAARAEWISDGLFWYCPNGKLNADFNISDVRLYNALQIKVFLQIIQGVVIGRLTTRYSESSLLLLSVGVSSMVGLGQVRRQTGFSDLSANTCMLACTVDTIGSTMGQKKKEVNSVSSSWKVNVSISVCGNQLQKIYQRRTLDQSTQTH